MKSVKWFVEIVEFGTDKIEKKLGPYANERTADKASNGVDRNLNHDKYFTRVMSGIV